ncbi:MAG: tail fiber domain-containing protein, partial [Chloroflexi bacterium]|nr:tail fiber domain-containing protein [Chloroflexota bacterium]
RAAGGTRIFSNAAASVGVSLAAGGNSWAVISDRNVKANFDAVDGRDVLDQLASIPIETWNLKSQDESIRHIGPMAQDFYAAFDVGENNTHITTSDADGVALAAIQGLYELAQEQESQIAALKGEGVAPAEAASAKLALTGGEGSNGLVYGLLLALLLALPAAVVAGVLGRRAFAQARSAR